MILENIDKFKIHIYEHKMSGPDYPVAEQHDRITYNVDTLK